MGNVTGSVRSTQWTPEEAAKMDALLRQGATMNQIARAFAVGNAVFIEVPGARIEAAIGLRDADQAEFVAFHVGKVIESMAKRIEELERQLEESRR